MKILENMFNRYVAIPFWKTLQWAVDKCNYVSAETRTKGALYQAAEFGMNDMIEGIFEQSKYSKGVKITQKALDNSLIIATMENNASTANLLLEKGANTDQFNAFSNKKSSKALDIAKENGFKETANLIENKRTGETAVPVPATPKA